MGERQTSALDPEKMERLCQIAEEAARNYIMSRVPRRELSDFDISIEAGPREGSLTVDVDIEVRFSSLLKDLDAKRLAKEAVDEAFKSVEKFLREDECPSRK